MEEDKPLETDASEDETIDEDTQSGSDSSQAGEEDVSNLDGFKTKLEEISGREFKSEEDAIKHYKELSSYVGKKMEDSVEEKPKVAPKAQANEVIERLDRFEFLNENPDAKEHFEEYVKPLSTAKDISLAEAWEQFKPLIEAKKEQENEIEVGINSKNRIQPSQNTDLKKLKQNALEGNSEAQEALVAKELEGLI